MTVQELFELVNGVKDALESMGINPADMLISTNAYGSETIHLELWIGDYLGSTMVYAQEVKKLV